MGTHAGGKRQSTRGDHRHGGVDGPQDHDLPLLGCRAHPRPHLDWEPLLAEGVHPSLALGAERRSRGPR